MGKQGAASGEQGAVSPSSENKSSSRPGLCTLTSRVALGLITLASGFTKAGTPSQHWADINPASVGTRYPAKCHHACWSGVKTCRHPLRPSSLLEGIPAPRVVSPIQATGCRRSHTTHLKQECLGFLLVPLGAAGSPRRGSESPAHSPVRSQPKGSTSCHHGNAPSWTRDFSYLPPQPTPDCGRELPRQALSKFPTHPSRRGKKCSPVTSCFTGHTVVTSDTWSSRHQQW